MNTLVFKTKNTIICVEKVLQVVGKFSFLLSFPQFIWVKCDKMQTVLLILINLKYLMHPQFYSKFSLVHLRFIILNIIFYLTLT